MTGKSFACNFQFKQQARPTSSPVAPALGTRSSTTDRDSGFAGFPIPDHRSRLRLRPEAVTPCRPSDPQPAPDCCPLSRPHSSPHETGWERVRVRDVPPHAPPAWNEQFLGTRDSRFGLRDFRWRTPPIGIGIRYRLSRSAFLTRDRDSGFPTPDLGRRLRSRWRNRTRSPRPKSDSRPPIPIAITTRSGGPLPTVRSTARLRPLSPLPPSLILP